MPPRYVYWTIIVDGQPTAFRSGSLEDIMPTFNRLKEKQPTAELKWFQNGQLWPSRHDAQDFMRARGERGRAKDPRQGGDDAGAPRAERAWNAKPEWKTRSSFSPRSKDAGAKPEWKPKGEKPAWVPKGEVRAARPAEGKADFAPRAGGASTFAKPPADKSARPPASKSGERPEWKPKGTFKPKEAGHASGWGEKPAFARRSNSPSAGQARSGGDKPAWKPKSGDKPEWKPKGTFKPREEGHRPTARDQARSSFKPKSYTPKVDDGRTRSSRVQSRNDKLEWAPKGSGSTAHRDSRPKGPNAGFAKSRDGVASGFGRSPAEGNERPEGKRKWVPKAEYKKSLGIEPKKDAKWRPGGDHVDPKQKYKDAKKAKWTKFKANIRTRSARPRKPKDE